MVRDHWSSPPGAAWIAASFAVLSWVLMGAGGAEDAGTVAQSRARPEVEAPSQATGQPAGETAVQPELELNGFDLRSSVVSPGAIIAGGPPRDGIRGVDVPQFVSPREASWAPPPVPVIGVAFDGEARAYPVHLLEYHQVVNDRLGATPLLVTYDPLTGVPKAHHRVVENRELHFGVSGLVYKASFLLYDRETESLWSQYLGKAVSGPLAGRVLRSIPTRQEPMGVWSERHPQTTVLVRPEVTRIDYRHSPYQAYWISEKVPFPVEAADPRYHPKEVVLGVAVGDARRAYLGSILAAEGGRIVDDFKGRKIRVAYDSDISTFVWEAPEDVSVTDAYWFAWKSFHPDTDIWHDRESEPGE
jgi:hypothetical protein